MTHHTTFFDSSKSNRSCYHMTLHRMVFCNAIFVMHSKSEVIARSEIPRTAPCTHIRRTAEIRKNCTMKHAQDKYNVSYLFEQKNSKAYCRNSFQIIDDCGCTSIYVPPFVALALIIVAPPTQVFWKTCLNLKMSLGRKLTKNADIL